MDSLAAPALTSELSSACRGPGGHAGRAGHGRGVNSIRGGGVELRSQRGHLLLRGTQQLPGLLLQGVLGLQLFLSFQ